MELVTSTTLRCLLASADLFHRMSPYLLFGFLFAGILHVFVPLESVARHLGGRNFISIIKAVLFGIPLPLCSCAVMPAAITLKKKGAGSGAVLSFLISTPITGADSILATYALLGPVFMLYRLSAAALTALIAGLLANLSQSEPIQPQETSEAKNCTHCHTHEPGGEITERDTPPPGFRLKALFQYAFGELLGEIAKPLFIGILVGGAITTLIPSELIERYFANPFAAMSLMLLIGIPMYVCATGSIPIAAAFIIKGISPGAALVFLLAGPATNSATIAVIWRELGRSAVAIYLGSIVVVSVGMGMLLNQQWPTLGANIQKHMHGAMELPASVQGVATAVLAGLLLWQLYQGVKRPHKVS